MGSIVTEVKNELTSILEILPDAVKRLRSVAQISASKTSTEEKEQFKPAWSLLTDSLPHLEEETRVNQATEGQQSTMTISLRNVIMDLIRAKDLEEARTIWKKQCSYWQARPKDISPADNDTLILLAYEAIISRLNRRSYFMHEYKNDSSREYAKDFI